MAIFIKIQKTDDQANVYSIVDSEQNFVNTSNILTIERDGKPYWVPLVLDDQVVLISNTITHTAGPVTDVVESTQVTRVLSAVARSSSQVASIVRQQALEAYERDLPAPSEEFHLVWKFIREMYRVMKLAEDPLDANTVVQVSNTNLQAAGDLFRYRVDNRPPLKKGAIDY